MLKLAYKVNKNMLWFSRRRFAKRLTLLTLTVMMTIFTVVFIIVPLIFKYSYSFQRSVVFLNFVQVPLDADYAHPSKYGIDNARNFYIETDDGIRLGVWQILSENVTHTSKLNETSDQYYNNIMKDGHDVIIYCHGNAGTRLTEHRLHLYTVLRKHFHVIAFDYRSYADSSNVHPSEALLVKDSIAVYEWVAARTKGNLFIWGHSLGTSIAIEALSYLQKKDLRPIGVILESPFNNMREEIREFPLAWAFRNMPWFSYTVVEPLQENGFKFETDKHICNVDAPILILHAEDDHVVPFKLGRKLFEAALRCRTDQQGKVSFIRFDGKYKYNHKFICTSPQLHDIISNFVDESIEETRAKHLKSA